MNSIRLDHPALVLGLTESGLGAIRSLGRYGVKVFGMDYIKNLGFHSKYSENFICPHPLKSNEEFIKFLLNFRNKVRFNPVVIIGDDAFYEGILSGFEKLKDNYLFNYSEMKTAVDIISKKNQIMFADKAGLQTPGTYFVTRENYTENDLQIDNFPVFVRGLNSSHWRNRYGGTIKGFKAESLDELHKIVADAKASKLELVIQEIIPGAPKNNYEIGCYISKTGLDTFFLTMRKIRQYPLEFGVGCSVFTFYNPEVQKLSEQFLKHINYRGLANIEFKFDARDGKYKFIEINPRLWMQSELATMAGINFSLIQFLDLTDQLDEVSHDYSDGIKWINIYSDVKAFMRLRKESEIGIFSWLAEVFKKSMLSDFARDDLGPFLSEIEYGKVLLKSYKLFLSNKYN